MPLVKSEHAHAEAKGAVVLDLGDLRAEAERIVAEARVEAERIVAAARVRERELIEGAAERGYAEGVARGEAEGLEQGRAAGHAAAAAECSERFATIAARWEETLERWESEFVALLQAARDDVLAFAFAMARKVVLRVPEVDPTVVGDQMTEALSYLSRPSAITVVVHPDDRPIIETVLPAVTARLESGLHAHIETDGTITRGGCILRTGHGLVDATLDTQIDRIAASLLPAPADRAEAEPTDGETTS
jgi:flagellar biosynthesis/type III secretory pathway protein FliH